MIGIQLWAFFGADLNCSEVQHLVAVRGLLLSWLNRCSDRRGRKASTIQGLLGEIEHRLAVEFNFADLRDLPQSPQNLFERYLNEISYSWETLARVRRMEDCFFSLHLSKSPGL